MTVETRPLEKAAFHRYMCSQSSSDQTRGADAEDRVAYILQRKTKGLLRADDGSTIVDNGKTSPTRLRIVAMIRWHTGLKLVVNTKGRLSSGHLYNVPSEGSELPRD